MKKNNQTLKSYSDAVKMSKCEDQWYKKFGSFLIGIVNGRKDFLHSCGVVGLSMVLISSVPAVHSDPALNALPTGYQSVAGNVEFNQAGNTLNVSTQANSSIANYQTFNVGQNATVNFNLPSSQSAILNRVTGGIGSEIFGSINSNGKVFLVNPSGVLFGSTAQVNVGSLVTSTLNTSNEKFLNGNYSFEQQGNTPGSIVNQGKITAKDGSVVLLGGAVQNTGSINAPNGSIQMAVGKSATILTSDGINVDVQINESLKEKVEGVQSAISNTGSLSANSIKAQAELNGAIYDQAINNKGLIQANSFTNKNGNIELVSKTGIVENTGSLIANNSNGKGGNIKVIGTETYLLNGSIVEANGKVGGGTVLIGGDFQGKGENNSKNTFIGENAEIKANALESGNGGKVIVWADENTILNGDIEAKGIERGGFIETSGKENIAIGKSAWIDTSSTSGIYGDWLLDPLNITISNTGSDTPTLAQLSNPLNFANYNVSPVWLNSLGSNITLLARQNITNDSNFSLNSGRTFTALAGRDVVFNTGSGLTTTNGSIILGASRNINLNNANLTANNGDIVLVSGARIPLPLSLLVPSAPAGGTITGAGVLTGTSLAAASMSGGNVTLNNAANNFTNLTAFLDNAGTFTYRDANAIRLQNYAVPPAVALQLAIIGLPATYTNDLGLGNLTLTAGGDITQAAGANLTGVQALDVTTTGTGNIILNQPTNNTNTLKLTTAGGSANFSDVGGFTINGIQLNNGDLTLRAGGSGSIAQNSDIKQVNVFNLNSGTGSATLTRLGNDVASFNANTAAGNANTIAFTDANGFTLGNSNVGSGNLVLTAAGGGTGAGDITQITGNSVQGNSLSLQTGSGTANINNADFTNLTTNTNNGSVTYSDQDGISVGNSNVGSGTLTINSSATGVTANNGNAEANLVLRNASSITGNTINLNANGSDLITQSILLGSRIQGTNLNLTTQGSNANIVNADFTNLTANTNNGSVTYSDQDGISVGNSNVGSGTLTINSSATGLTANNGNAEENLVLRNASSITGNTINLNANGADNIIQNDDSVMTGTNLSLNTNSGTADVGGFGAFGGTSNFTNLQANSTSGTITYGDANGINLLTSNVGTGDLLVGALGTGDIKQTGSITGNNLVVGTANGDVILDNTANQFNGFTANTTLLGAGTGTVSYTNNGSIDLQEYNTPVGNAAFDIGSGTLNITTVPTSNGNINIASDVTGQTINLNSGGAGNISQNVGTSVQGNNLSLATGSGTATLNNTGNNFANLTSSSTSGAISYTDADTINLQASNVGTGTLNVSNVLGDINQSGIIRGGNLLANANQGNVNLFVVGLANDFNNLGLSALNNASYLDSDGININSVSGAGNTLSITAGNAPNPNGQDTATGITINSNITAAFINLSAEAGNISQNAGTTIQGTGLNLSTAGGNATINDADFTNLSANTNNGTATYSDRDGINIGSSNVGTGTLTVNSSVAALVSDNGNTETNLTLAGDITGQTVILNANGADNIDQISDNFTGGNLNLNTQGGTVNLGINGNTDFAIIGGNTNGGNATYIDTDGLTVSDFNVGNGTLNIISSKGNNSVNLNGDPFGPENDIVLNGLINGANVNLIAQTNDAIVQTVEL